MKLDKVEQALEWIRAEHSLGDGEINVLVTTDEAVQGLNRQFRGIDEPTDVLTFPAPDTARTQVGDIAVSIGFARRQAESRSVPIEEEVAMLAIHGGLHLAGFDDATQEQVDEMVARMNEAAVAVGVQPEAGWASLPHGSQA